MKCKLATGLLVLLISVTGFIIQGPRALLGDGGLAAAQGPPTPIPSRASVAGEVATDAAVIWRGFDQKWTLANHRLNRLGDYIGGINYSGSSCSANLVHAAASGLAGDIARYTTYYTEISAVGVGFQPGNRALTLSGSEGAPISLEAPVSVSADANMKGRGRYTVLLNGFDLCASESADKIQHLRIALTNPTYDQDSDTLNFKIVVQLTANCTSIECPAKDRVDYNMRIYYLIIGGEEEMFYKVSREFSRHYSWDKENEIHLRDLNEEHSLQGEPGHPVGVFGFRSLEFDLDRDHWMFEWASYVQPISYSQQSGKGEFNLALMFKQWTTGMMAGAQKRSGSATVSARVILLQFKNAERRNTSYSGSVEWAGTLGGAPSSGCSEKAMTSHSIGFEIHH